MEIELLNEIKHNGWKLPEDIVNCLSPYEIAFLKSELTGSNRKFEIYTSRLKYLGFENMGKVLDAGCGYGQWSAALSKLNQEVYSVDISPTRLLTAKHFLSSMGSSNANFSYASLDDLPFPSNYFDSVFCYSVFMFTDMPKTLEEFNRVLKPNGKLYLNTDTLGWYAHLLIDVRQDRIDALKMIARTILGKTKKIVVRESWLLMQLARTGFNIVDIGSEGETSFLPNQSMVRPGSFYPTSYYGMRGVLEVAATKK